MLRKNTQVKLFGFAALAVAAVGCRGHSGDSAVKDAPLAAVGMPIMESVEIAKLTGDAARLVYTKLDASEESLGDDMTYKSVRGAIQVACEKTGGTLPPGAQGMPGAVEHNCWGTYPDSIPDGAQGMPAAPFLKINGSAAAKLFQALNFVDFDGQKLWKSEDGSFECRREGGSLPPGAQGFPGATIYTCTILDYAEQPQPQGLPGPGH